MATETMTETDSAQQTQDVHIRFADVSVHYGRKCALEPFSLDIPRHELFAIIGPANSGKTTLLKCINRTLDFVPAAKVRGQVLINGDDIGKIRSVEKLRRRIGMVFPLPVGLP